MGHHYSAFGTFEGAFCRPPCTLLRQLFQGGRQLFRGGRAHPGPLIIRPLLVTDICITLLIIQCTSSFQTGRAVLFTPCMPKCSIILGIKILKQFLIKYLISILLSLFNCQFVSVFPLESVIINYTASRAANAAPKRGGCNNLVFKII